MPKNYRSPLCVGGPLDGRRVDGQPGKTAFEVAMRGFSWTGRPMPAELEDSTPIISRHVYRMQDIHFDGGTVQFWAPETQPMNDTIAMLLKAYEEAAIAACGIITPKSGRAA